MPRIRSIKPAFWTSPQIVHVPIPARLLFIGTWNFADDNGNLPRDAERLKLQIFPADDIDVEPLVCALITHGLLIEYSVSCRRYLHIVGFRAHQVISRPSRAAYPKPPDTAEKPASTGNDGNSPAAENGENSQSTHGVVMERSLMEEEKDKTRNIKTKVKNKSTARVPRAVSAPRFDAGTYLRSLGVADDLAADWLAVRKGKHLTATRTAMAGVLREVEKTGLPLPDVLRICCEKGWGGFEAHWLENLSRDTHGPPPFALSPRDVREARNRAMVTTLTGRDPWEPPPDVIDLAPEDVHHVPDRRH
ncbi:hypothetical protein [Paraburkholderia adhaesiva]|uniref:hypothetical protein n=1 Tax=Paraburkholderia adhaesiva TaxID=2883244 RepID=UPI001F16F368|nr:hypothetical protein [Paraburkholderia adhaesiva]